MSEDSFDLDKERAKHEAAYNKYEHKSRLGTMRQLEGVDLPLSSDIILMNEIDKRQTTKRAVFTAMVLTFALLVLVVATFIISMRPVETLALQSDPYGNTVYLEPVNVPSLTNEEILNVATQYIYKLNRMSFSDYEQRVLELEFDFLPESYKRWKAALARSQELEKIKADSLTQWVEPLGEIKIVREGVNSNNRYEWEVQMKIKRSLGGGNHAVTATNFIVNMTLVRVSRSSNIKGVAIKSFIQKETGRVQ